MAISYFNATDTGVFYAGTITSTGGRNRFDTQNGEMWFRVSGSDLKLRYTAGGSTPIWLQVDDGSWVTPTGFISTGSTLTSANILPSGTTDAGHDIRIRVQNGYTSNFAVLQVSGIVVESSGTPGFARHSHYGEYYNYTSVFPSSYWSETLSSTSSSFSQGRNKYIEFYVDGNSDKLYFWNSSSDEQFQFSLYINNARLADYSRANTTVGNARMQGPYTIPGSGQRLVRIVNIHNSREILVNGAFPAVAVNQPTTKVLWFGDSVTAGDSASNETNPSSNWDILTQILLQNHKSINRGLSGNHVRIASGQVAGNITTNSPDYVICNLGINDAAYFAASGAQASADYATLFNEIINNNPSTTLYVVPQLEYQPTSRTSIVAGLQNAVSQVNSSRCLFYSSDGWDVSVAAGSHPYDIGKAEAVGYDVVAVQVSGQPSNGDTLTLNSTVFEFDSDSSVAMGNIPVTIGASISGTVENLSTAILNNQSGFGLLAKAMSPLLSTVKGVICSGVTSASDTSSGIFLRYSDSGWADFVNSFLTPSQSQELFMRIISGNVINNGGSSVYINRINSRSISPTIISYNMDNQQSILEDRFDDPTYYKS